MHVHCSKQWTEITNTNNSPIRPEIILELRDLNIIQGGFLDFENILFNTASSQTPLYVSEDAGIEPRAIAMLARDVRLFNRLARSHPIGIK
jgi:hypothetical protein